ncbi:hypothetical protein MSPP1_000940 [Malassezia sp. CBS 17886]|nr:hypothetical protein MSPP1_000940 [Malassezia sp. CBS 17886]
MWANAATVVLALLVLRLGVGAALLVVACAVVMLCHPTVRVFLELGAPAWLAPGDCAARDESRLDALRGRLTHLSAHSAPAPAPAQPAVPPGPEALAAVPAEVRPELARIIALVRRDFIQYWYDPISFGDAIFPDEAVAGLEHLVAYVAQPLKQHRHSSVASELSLTALSVVIAALRRRHDAGTSDRGGTPMGLWANDAARIESVRAAVLALLAQGLPPNDSRSPVLKTLLAEVLTKQLWTTLKTHSDPDTMNQWIVSWGRADGDAAAAAARVASLSGDVGGVSGDVGGVSDDFVHKAESIAQGGNRGGDGRGGEDTAAGMGAEATTRGDNVPLPSDALYKEPLLHDPLLNDQGTHVVSKQGRAAAGPQTNTANGAPRNRSHLNSVQPPREGGEAREERGNAAAHAGEGPLGTPPSPPPAAPRETTTTQQAADKQKRAPPPPPPRRFTPPRVDKAREQKNTDARPPAERGAPSSDAGATTRPAPPRALPMNIPPRMDEPRLPTGLAQSRTTGAAPCVGRRASHPALADASDDERHRASPGLRYEPRRTTASPRPRTPSRGRTLREVLTKREPEVMDAFETFLQQGAPANEDSHQAEGMVLLQLHANMEMLASAALHHSTTPSVFAGDARAVLQVADAALAESGARHAGVRRAVGAALRGAPSSSLAALEPVRDAVYARLQQLYDAFLHAQGTDSPGGGAAPRDKWRGPTPRALAYEPRRISHPSGARAPPDAHADDAETTDTVDINVVDASGAAPGGSTPVDPRHFQVLITMEDVASAASGSGGYVLLRSWPQFELLNTELMRLYAQRPGDSVLRVPPPPLPALRGLSSDAACAEIRVYLLALLAPARDGAWYSSAQVVLRFIDKTRAGEASEPSTRARGNLINSLGGMSRSLASGVAGAAGSARKGFGQMASVTPSQAARRGAPGRGLFPRRDEQERCVAARRPPESDAAWSDTGALALPPRAAQPTPMHGVSRDSIAGVLEGEWERVSSGLSEGVSEADSEGVSRGVPEGVPGDARARGVATESSGDRAEGLGTCPPSTRPPRAADASPDTSRPATPDVTPEEADALLAAVFAVMHEAFHVQGAWTLRRGLLRVLEQVVRTTYSTSVVSTLVYLSSMLSAASIASWLAHIRTSLWPDGVWSTAQAPVRTHAEKLKTAQDARDIVLSYTPTQAVYALGIGGRQACMEALATVHEVVTEPVVALDLHLALLLRVLDLAMVGG